MTKEKSLPQGRGAINRLAEFRDREQENRFLRAHFANTKGRLQLIVLLFGGLFLGVAVFDALDLRDLQALLPSLLIRAGVMALSVAAALCIGRARDGMACMKWLTLYECVFLAAYFLLLYQQRAQGFIEQAMAVMAIILVAFLLPNRWIYNAVFALTASGFFLLMAPFYIREIPRYTAARVVLYLLVTAVASGVGSHQVNQHRRAQFAKERELGRLLETDRLTGVFNRNKFDDALEQWFVLHERKGVGFSVIMFDLDNFKALNDTRGHLAGDRVLRECAGIVRRDVRVNDLFARWGGEEFMILLPLTTLACAKEMAERLRRDIAGLNLEEDGPVTASFGVVTLREGDSPRTLMARLDSMMYKAKQSGKNCVVTEETDKTAAAVK